MTSLGKIYGQYPFEKYGKCGYCKFYDNSNTCRRFPPVPVAGTIVTTHFPRVDIDKDWCGEWKPNESLIDQFRS